MPPEGLPFDVDVDFDVGVDYVGKNVHSYEKHDHEDERVFEPHILDELQLQLLLALVPRRTFSFLHGAATFVHCL